MVWYNGIMINANKTANINQPSTSGPNKNIDSYGVAPDGSIVRVDWSTWPLYDGTPNKVTTPNKRIVAHVDGVPVQSGEDIAPTRTITPNHREVVYGINDEGNPAPLVQTGYGIAVTPNSASSPNKTNLVWVIGEDGSPIPLQVDHDGKIIGTVEYTNLATNPSFEDWTGTPNVVARTNLARNPSFGNSSLSTWSAENGGPIVRSYEDVGELKAMVVTCTGSSTYFAIGKYATNLEPLPSWAKHVTVSASRYSSVVNSGRFFITYYDADFVVVGGTNINIAGVPANQWNRHSHTAAVPDGAVFVGCYISIVGNFVAGDVIKFSKILIEPTDQLRPYFDGSYSDDVDFRVPSWTGTANNSASVLKIAGTSEVRRNLNPNPRMVGDTNGVANGYILYSQSTSTGTASKPSANIQRLHQTAATVSGAISQLSRSDIEVSANTTYTAQVKVTGLSLSGSTIQLMWEEYSGTTWVAQGSSVNITGEGVFSITGTTSATTNVLRVRVRVISTGTSPDSYVDFTNFCLEKIGVLLPYFDGSTNTWQAPDLAPKWTGAVDNSTSVLVGVKPEKFNADGGVAWLSSDNANHGKKFVRNMILKTGGESWYECADQALSLVGDTATFGLAVRANVNMPTVGNVCFNNGGQSGTNLKNYSLVANEWTNMQDVNRNITNVFDKSNGVSLWNNTGLYTGALIDIDNHFVVKGEYDGEYFDGDSPGCEWNGAPNKSTSTKRS